MKDITITSKEAISIGKVGENEAIRLIFKGILTEWRRLYGDGMVVIAFQRPRDRRPYLVASTVDGDDVKMNITATELMNRGMGKLEIIYTVNATVVKSDVWPVIICESITGNGTSEPPESPEKNWFDEIRNELAEVKGAVDEITSAGNDWYQNDPTKPDHIKNRPGGYIVDEDGIRKDVKIPMRWLDIVEGTSLNAIAMLYETGILTPAQQDGTFYLAPTGEIYII